MTTTKKTPKLVGEILLYGHQTIGHGWLARTTKHVLLGDGTTRQGLSATEALWIACEAVRNEGFRTGLVRVFAPGGQLVAEANLNSPGYYGSLKWQHAVAYVISAEAVIAVAV